MQQNASLNAIMANWIIACKNNKTYIHQIMVSWECSYYCGLKTNSSNWASPAELAVLCYCTYSAPCLWRVNCFSDTSKHILFCTCNVLRPCIWPVLLAYLASNSLIACNHYFYPKVNTRYIGFCITGWSYRQCHICDQQNLIHIYWAQKRILAV